SRDCVEECGEASLSCITACEETRLPCMTCAVQAARSCGGAVCAASLLQTRECLLECGLSAVAFDSAMGRCLEATCGEALDALSDCVDPILAREGCGEALGDCGL